MGGAIERDRLVPSVAIVRGGATVAADVTIGSAVNACAPDGLLGMDALRQCVVVLGQRVMLRCRR